MIEDKVSQSLLLNYHYFSSQKCKPIDCRQIQNTRPIQNSNQVLDT